MPQLETTLFYQTTVGIILLLIGSTLFSALINFLFLNYIKRVKAPKVPKQDQERWSSEYKPAIGGFSLFILFLVGVFILNVFAINVESFLTKPVLGMLFACSLGFIIGLTDDMYNTNPLMKFVGQMVCAFILMACDVVIVISDFDILNFIFTTVWIIGIMNSINMLDNMDGVTGTISALILAASYFILRSTGVANPQLDVLLLTGIGGLIGFLCFNWHPSKMYMGDTGSQFLGVFLSAVSILILWNQGFRHPKFGSFQLSQFILPGLVFIVPLLDTFTVSIHRLARRQSPFVGGKDHTTHHLVYLGVSQRFVVVVLATIAILASALGYYLVNHTDVWTYQVTISLIAGAVLFFIICQVLYLRGKKLQPKA